MGKPYSLQNLGDGKMFAKLTFMINENQITIADETFLLGELTCDVLSITPAEYKVLNKKSSDILLLLKKENNYDEQNNIFDEINEMLLKRKLFKAIFRAVKKEEKDVVNLDEILELIDSESDREEFTKISNKTYDDSNIYLANRYRDIINDLYAFNQTMFNFIDHYLSTLKKLDSENYAAALFDYYNSPYYYKMSVNYFNSDTSFSHFDNIDIRFEPREIAKDKYAILEIGTTDSLQAFLKIDFMRALMIGHTIRRCKNCKQFFLLTKGYHTEYCDRPIVDNPKQNCRSQGAKNIAKEKAANNPKIKSYERAYQRIYIDARRGNITELDKKKALREIRDLRDKAMVNNISDDKLDEQLQSNAVYNSLGIKRKVKK